MIEAYDQFAGLVPGAVEEPAVFVPEPVSTYATGSSVTSHCASGRASTRHWC
jgi:hypothetical protein